MLCTICNNDTKLIKSRYLPRFYSCSVCSGNILKEKVKAKYPEVYFQEKTSPSVIAKLATPILGFLLSRKTSEILSLINKDHPKILDYGCGSGRLVIELINKGSQAIGFEPSEGARKLTTRKNLPVFNKIKVIPGGYDLIMFWHSLEHTDNPFEIIKKVSKHLSKNGKILVAVPNADSFEARISKDKWFHYSYPLHTIHFTPKSLKIALQKTGFQNISIDYLNPEYTVSGLLQTYLNLLLPKDVLYSVVSHRRLSMPIQKAILFSLLSIILLVISSPLLILFFIIQLIFQKSGAMVVTAKL